MVETVFRDGRLQVQVDWRCRSSRLVVTLANFEVDQRLDAAPFIYPAETLGAHDL